MKKVSNKTTYSFSRKAKKSISAFLIALSGIVMAPALDAEIEYIIIKWLPTACLGSCVQTIANQLQSIGGAAQIVINQQQGQATLRWKPRVPFSYDYINTAMRLVGPKVQDLRMKVRGTIVSTPSAIILKSLGDETQFVLLSPATGSLTQYVPQNNIDSHILAPQTRQQFLDGERDFTVVTVEGPLFEPQRMQGLYLIVQQASFNRLSQN